MWWRWWVAAPLGIALLAALVHVYPSLPMAHKGTLLYLCHRPGAERVNVEATVESVSRLGVGPDTAVTVIIHGYTESSFRSWVPRLTDGVMASSGGVVVLVDYWDMTTLSRPYMNRNIRGVAALVAKLIHLMVTQKRVRLSNVHIVGFSLGGRIAGMVSPHLHTGRIGRITGVDASYPWHEDAAHDDYLDPSDADLVMTLRTSPVAARTPPTHLDFYANNGLDQPGCDKWYYPGFVNRICSHYRAIDLLLESLTSPHAEAFPACGCSSWQEFTTGNCDCQTTNHFTLFPDKSTRGSFYFETNAEPPYSKVLKN